MRGPRLPRAAAGTGVRRLRILTGNPDTRRDFTDVRDVVAAYRALAISTLDGTVNVCSGTSVSAADQVRVLGELLALIEVEHVVDPRLVRPSEVSELRGDPTRVRAATGWSPRIPFAQTMADTLAFWEREDIDIAGVRRRADAAARLSRE